MWSPPSRRPLVVAVTFVAVAAVYLMLRPARRAPEPPLEPEPPTVPCTTLPEERGWVNGVAISPGDDLLAIAVSQGELRGHCQLREVPSGRVRATLSRGGAMVAVAFSPDGRQVATGTRDGTVKVCDLAGGERVLPGAGPHRIWQVAFSPDGKALAAGSYFGVTLWDLAQGGAGVAMPGRAPLAFAAGGKTLATATTGGGVQLWDLATGTSRAVAERDPGREPAASGLPLAFAPDGKSWVREGRVTPGTTHLWDARRQPRATLAGHEQVVNAVVFSPDGAAVATASNDRTIKVWDAATGRLRATLTGHTGAVYCVAYSRDGGWLASGGFDKAAKLWQLTRAAGGGNP